MIPQINIDFIDVRNFEVDTFATDVFTHGKSFQHTPATLNDTLIVSSYSFSNVYVPYTTSHVFVVKIVYK